MNLVYFTDRLRANIEVIRGLLTAIPEDQARWKPQPEKWSLLEVINHLADEEVEDFRTRVKLSIESPNEDWPGIDPERSAVERAYNTRNLAESLGRFISERQVSLTWLGGLKSVPWETAHQHGQFRPLRVGDLIAAWLAHDLIHIRQMNRLHFEYLQAAKGSFSADYAGKW